MYHVTGTEVVAPEDYNAVIPTTDATKATLTLVSCTPRYSAKNRIVVRSELVPDQSDALTEAPPVGPVADPSVTALPGDDPATVVDTVDPTATTAPTENTSAQNTVRHTARSRRRATRHRRYRRRLPWRHHPTPSPTAGSATAPPSHRRSCGAPLLAAIAYGIYWLSRRFRRYWVGILAGFVPFIVALYFFYENVNRLLPPNL